MKLIGGGPRLTKRQEKAIKNSANASRKRNALNAKIRTIGRSTAKKKAARNKALKDWGRLTQAERNTRMRTKGARKMVKTAPNQKASKLHTFVLAINKLMITLMQEHDNKKKGSDNLLHYIITEFAKKKNPIKPLIKYLKKEKKKVALSKVQIKDINQVLKNLDKIVNPKGGSGQRINPIFNAVMMPSVPTNELPIVFPSVPNIPMPKIKKTRKKAGVTTNGR